MNHATSKTQSTTTPSTSKEKEEKTSPPKRTKKSATVPARPRTKTAKKTSPSKKESRPPASKTRADASPPHRNSRQSRPDSRTSPEPVRHRGVVRVHQRGFGFLDLDSGASAFVPPPLLRGFLDSDRVSAVLLAEPDGRSSALELELIERTRTLLVGVVEASGASLQLRPDPHVANSTWPLLGAAGAGDNVVAEVGDGKCTLLRTLGPLEDPEAIRTRVLERHRIASEPTAVDRSPRATQANRRDLRDLVTFTIDAPYSADLDDALSVAPPAPDGSIRVIVHIADVAEHVAPGSTLDLQAQTRATSVYLPGSNIPMLPRALSEDSLSLLPGVERDALSVELRVTPEGEVSATDIFETRIRSDARLSYEAAAEVLAGRSSPEVSAPIATALRHLRTLSARIGLQRVRRGGVEARRVEPELNVELRDGSVATTGAQASNPAHLLIERLMVATNEAVAQWLVMRGLPALFRVHPEPRPGASDELELFASNLGYHPGFGPRLTPLALAAFADQLSGASDPRTNAVWDVLLAFLGRAQYQPQPGPHFGLGSDGYLHFTSPLRRYADLSVHRVVKSYLRGARDAGEFTTPEDLDVLARHVNERAQSAKRAELDMRQLLWLSTLKGRRTPTRARVTSITARGLRLSVEGSLLAATVDLGDLANGPWNPEPEKHRVRSATGAVLELGSVLELVVKRIDLEAGTLELRSKRTRRAAGDDPPPSHSRRPSAATSRRSQGTPDSEPAATPEAPAREASGWTQFRPFRAEPLFPTGS